MFQRVQALLGEKVYKANELLYGGALIRCGHCGRPMTGEVVVKKATGRSTRPRTQSCAIGWRR